MGVSHDEEGDDVTMSAERARVIVTAAGRAGAIASGHSTAGEAGSWRDMLRYAQGDDLAAIFALDYELAEALYGLGYLRECARYRDRVASCTCGRWYDVDDWAALTLCGRIEDLELRHCVCGSTISREVKL